MLFQELRDVAYEQIHEIPRDSAITRLNRRCAITGRARGIFHQVNFDSFTIVLYWLYHSGKISDNELSLVFYIYIYL
jgi:hypothetical protein